MKSLIIPESQFSELDRACKCELNPIQSQVSNSWIGKMETLAQENASRDWKLAKMKKTQVGSILTAICERGGRRFERRESKTSES